MTAYERGLPGEDPAGTGQHASSSARSWLARSTSPSTRARGRGRARAAPRFIAGWCHRGKAGLVGARELAEHECGGGALAQARRDGGDDARNGVHEDTIRKGIREFECGEPLPAGRVRKAGAGRKSLTGSDPTLLGDLEGLVKDEARG